jgi:hypothetical protein
MRSWCADAVGDKASYINCEKDLHERKGLESANRLRARRTSGQDPAQCRPKDAGKVAALQMREL